jgi:trimethylamine:corrinoid methyltransferase-like protein
MDIEVILQACRYGIPIHASSLPVMGGTCPITIAGTVLVAGIEVLAMVTIAQILRSGIPVIGLATALSMDMRSGRAVKASPEAMLANAACAQFIRKAFRIPTHTAGFTTDMFQPDGQAMTEHSLYAFMVAAAGASILGRAGELEAAKTISPIQLIVDNEVAGVLKRLHRGIKLSEETLTWEDILAVAPGGHFLETVHTLRYCRDAFQPRLFLRQSRDSWESKGCPDLITRAQERYRELIVEAKESEILDSVREEMDQIVREADLTLAQQRGRG